MIQVETAEFQAPNTLSLPTAIAARFQPADRFMIWADGDTVYLRRMQPSTVTELVAHAPVAEPPSLEEINEIVHEVRRARRRT